ncbi:unnamed protein product [Calypogeia fissa]
MLPAATFTTTPLRLRSGLLAAAAEKPAVAPAADDGKEVGNKNNIDRHNPSWRKQAIIIIIPYSATGGHDGECEVIRKELAQNTPADDEKLIDVVLTTSKFDTSSSGLRAFSESGKRFYDSNAKKG